MAEGDENSPLGRPGEAISGTKFRLCQIAKHANSVQSEAFSILLKRVYLLKNTKQNIPHFPLIRHNTVVLPLEQNLRLID